MINTDLNQSFNKFKTEIMNNNYSDPIVNISKAHAFDIISEELTKVKDERDKLKADLNDIYNVFKETEAKDIIENPTQLTGKVLKILSNNSKLWAL